MDLHQFAVKVEDENDVTTDLGVSSDERFDPDS
jgi:hypothetical protein